MIKCLNIPEWIAEITIGISKLKKNRNKSNDSLNFFYEKIIFFYLFACKSVEMLIVAWF